MGNISDDFTVNHSTKEIQYHPPQATVVEVSLGGRYSIYTGLMTAKEASKNSGTTFEALMSYARQEWTG